MWPLQGPHRWPSRQDLQGSHPGLRRVNRSWGGAGKGGCSAWMPAKAPARLGTEGWSMRSGPGGIFTPGGRDLWVQGRHLAGLCSPASSCLALSSQNVCEGPAGTLCELGPLLSPPRRAPMFAAWAMQPVCPRPPPLCGACSHPTPRQPLAPTNLSPGSIEWPVLDVSSKKNHSV